jgi:transcriptional regulator with XRE-family HTH domain
MFDNRKLKELMHKRNVKARDIADSLGVHKVTVSRWTTGKGHPTTSHLRQLADMLDVSFKRFLEDQEESGSFGDRSSEKRQDGFKEDDVINYLVSLPDDSFDKVVYAAEKIRVMQNRGSDG